jgi:hypothetical protein
LEWKYLFEIWKTNWPYNQREMKKNWNKEIIYFVYVTQIKFQWYQYHMYIPPYTTVGKGPVWKDPTAESDVDGTIALAMRPE